jgi:enoyl-CoA hydratase/3-hydroxyacyl-CoA dehydrogenase
MKTIAVIGAGTMGHGIAQLAATAGYRVFLNDTKQEFIDKGMERIRWSINKFVEKDTISEEKSKEILGRLQPELDLIKAVEKADIVIEAVFEDLDIKQELMGKIDGHLKEGAVVATNTSTLPITEISEPLSHPENAIGMHFFNPPQLMPLIEIIRGEKTSDKTLEVIVNLSKEMGKDVVVCRKDVPGFIVNRILGPVYNEAAWMLEHGEADVLGIDSAVKYRLSLPMGIFELADYTGIDVIYRAQKYFKERGLEGEQPSIWEQKFKANEHGVKVGKGFYTYKTGPFGREQPKIPREAGTDVDLVRLFAAAINSGAEIVREKIATREDLEKSIEIGLAYPKGILKMADEFGLDKVVEKLKELQSKYGNQYKPDPLLEQLVNDGKTGINAGQGFYDYAKGKEEYKTIILRKDPESKIAWLTLNRPGRLNSFTLESIDDLRRAFLEIGDDPDIRVSVILVRVRKLSAQVPT